jgi:hypothetical protein
MTASRVWTLFFAAVLAAPPSLAADESPETADVTEDDTVLLPDLASPPPKPLVGFRKGFFMTSPDGKFGIKLGGRLQLRWSYERSSSDHEVNFSLPRVRFKFSGHVFDETIKYKFQMDWGEGGVSLKDALVDLKADDMVVVRLGQFKVPDSRQFIASSTKQHFVDRSITNKAFSVDRDVGVMLMSDWKKAPVEYAVGIWNGTGDDGLLSGDVTVDPATGEGAIDSGEVSNVPDLPNPLVLARFGAHTPGFDGYNEADYTDSAPGAGFGGSIYVNFDADDTDDASMGGTVDWSVKAKNFSHNGAVFIKADQDGDGFDDMALSNIGVFASVAYAIEGRVQPAFRFARLLPPGDNNDTTEILGGVTVFIFGDNVKWALDAGAIVTETATGDEATAQIRTQFQLDF